MLSSKPRVNQSHFLYFRRECLKPSFPLSVEKEYCGLVYSGRDHQNDSAWLL